MPLIQGRINPLKFNAQTIAAMLSSLGIIPSAVPSNVAVDMAQSLIESMLSSGVVEKK